MDTVIRVREAHGDWLELGHRELLAEGGEGRVYVRGEHAYKLYHDPARVIPAGKLRALAALDHPALICPRSLLLDGRDRPVGYRMARVRDGVPLVRLFAGDYQSREGLTPARLLSLCRAMAEVVAAVHGHDCLLVDANELNWLVLAPGHRRVTVIDVDSFQTPGYPATAQSPAIHDHGRTGFSRESDWFALAVLLCQLWVGVHPYKGQHPDFARHDLAGRMRAGVSLFDPAVRLPPSARNSHAIPEPWAGWLRAVLERGERLAPPAAASPGAVRTTVLAPLAANETGEVALEPVGQWNSPIAAVLSIHGCRVVITAEEIHLADSRYARPAGAGTVLLPRGADDPLWADIHGGELRLTGLRDRRVWSTGITARQLFTTGGRLYLLARDKLLEVRPHWLGEGWRALVAGAWPILPEATVMGEGLLWQTVLAQPRLLIPFRAGALAQLAVPELPGYRLLGGRWDAGVAVLVGSREARLDRLVLRFDPDHRGYRLDIHQDIDCASWNLAVLDTGVAVLGGDVLRVFFREPGRDGGRAVAAGRAAALTLAADGGQLLGYRAGELYRLRLSG